MTTEQSKKEENKISEAEYFEPLLSAVSKDDLFVEELITDLSYLTIGDNLKDSDTCVGFVKKIKSYALFCYKYKHNIGLKHKNSILNILMNYYEAIPKYEKNATDKDMCVCISKILDTVTAK